MMDQQIVFFVLPILLEENGQLAAYIYVFACRANIAIICILIKVGPTMGGG